MATCVRGDSRWELRPLAVRNSEDVALLITVLRSLRAREVHSTQLVISVAHVGLKSALGCVMIGCAWQRCRVHFPRNILAPVPTGFTEMVAAAILLIAAQPNAENVRAHLNVIETMLNREFPKVEAIFRDVADDITALADFPIAHWKEIWPTNPPEHVNMEIKRRTDVVRMTPTPPHTCAWQGPPLSRAITKVGLRAPLPVQGIRGPTTVPAYRDM